jgi:hypothetical protein
MRWRSCLHSSDVFAPESSSRASFVFPNLEVFIPHISYITHSLRTVFCLNLLVPLSGVELQIAEHGAWQF